MRILVVDDNEGTLQSLADLIKDLGHEAHLCRQADEALAATRNVFFPMVMTDIRMPGMNGLELLETLKADAVMQRADVLICTGHGDMNTAIDALRKGAYDYLNKPINARELAAVIDRVAEHQALLAENEALTHRMEDRVHQETQIIRRHLEEAQSQLRQVAGIGNFLAVSPAMKKIIEETGTYHDAPDVPVLIEGETGTGKEMIARLIHLGTANIDTPFVDINCTALSPTLFESELFGYEPGAFTGAQKDGSIGKLEQAGKGTVFFDEIGDMPLDLQPKLLRVLQDRSFYRVGGVKKRSFEARIICATNQDLRQLMEEGRFRRDLYHRLEVGHLRLPPLREQTEAILPLARMFLEREARIKKRAFQSVSPAAEALLQNCSWPGNVRQLEHAIERAVLTNDGTVLEAEHLAFLGEIAGSRVPASTNSPTPNTEMLPDMSSLPDDNFPLDAFIDSIIEKALEKFHGNKTHAAKYLGMSRGAFRNRLSRLE